MDQILSLVVGGQLGAKRAKLTPLRGLRGTKLQLKGALGAPKEAPREHWELNKSH